MGSKEEKRGFFKSLKDGLLKTRENITGSLDRIFSGRKRFDPESLEEIEEALVTADIGIKTAYKLVEGVEKGLRKKGFEEPGRLKQALKEQIREILESVQMPLLLGDERPFVIMAIGINGVGKTTTIAKIAYRFTREGKRVVLVAADTFRAAAIEQLEIWGKRAGADVIKQKTGADPSAVVYDGLQYASSRGIEVAIIDTAGRLHTKVNLMEELKKVKRVASKVITGAPHETLLIIDATTGQNAISQARMFNQALGVDGIAVTKLDGTAKGGIVIGISDEMGIPLRYIGIGEGLEDLRPFEAAAFTEAIFS